jgi:hypothetical protein
MQCTVWSDNVAKYQSMLIERIYYEITNISITENNHKFKPTYYECRTFLKNIIIVKPIDDSTIPFYVFKFILYNDIFKAKN